MSEATNQTPAPTADWMIEKYLALRAAKQALEAKHKAEIGKYNELMGGLENWLLKKMEGEKLSSLKSQHGTAYKTLRTSARVVDWASTLKFIRDNELWDLLEARVSKLAAQAVIEETKQPIPGVETAQEVCVNVRKAGEPTGK